MLRPLIVNLGHQHSKTRQMTLQVKNTPKTLVGGREGGYGCTGVIYHSILWGRLPYLWARCCFVLQGIDASMVLLLVQLD